LWLRSVIGSLLTDLTTAIVFGPPNRIRSEIGLVCTTSSPRNLVGPRAKARSFVSSVPWERN
jgi:hypothetical protein